ncbi:MAG: 3-oxoacyl-[acyl-carrier-protein] reductase [Cryomorphaceae bacterium]|nr:3-oxoacyl-[acyl-carrier-protein] reductase [Cryomorphaceae bacterium]
MKLLENKIVLITGGSQGIGKSIAQECIRQGATVAFTYRDENTQDQAKQVEKELNQNGGSAKAFMSDAANFDDAQELIADVISEFGTIDALVNNAGITRDTLLMRMSEQQWDDVINTNLKSAFNLTKAAQIPMLKARSGSIINMSSVVGVKGNAGQANYAASKAGLIGFTKSVAAELGSRGIRCNAIAPGFIETEMTKSLDEKVVEEWRNGIPLKRGGTPLDVANTTVFLASDMSSYVTGQTIHVCGGMLM